MHISRRSFLKATAVATAAGAYPRKAWTAAANARSAVREFHVCAAPQILETNPELLQVFAQSGVQHVWMAGFFYGYWPIEPAVIQKWMGRVRDAGMAPHAINIPLGHPGDALNAPDHTPPTAPPSHWRMAVKPDGGTYSGTSLHEPATAENVEAVKVLAGLGFDRLFLDDDFRLAVGPGVIGGCFCDEHRDAFLKQHGYAAERWPELLDDVKGRRLSPIMRSWVEFTCDQLTACFRAQQAAAPDLALGNMIMYFGAEKAGIRLSDYADALFRVGELMFNDDSFGNVKGKTGELFSCLFHRRYAKPELAYSETTAFPAVKLSARNMAAKLAVSTLSDVRNTMYMSGITPFPVTHWDVLAPAMRKHAAIHERLAGHKPAGPFKHYWGEASRYIGDDNPYSLFLAAGVPFEVTEQLGPEGWTFLSEWDARDVAEGKLQSAGTTLIARQAATPAAASIRVVSEDLPALFALKKEVTANLRDVPYVVDDEPVVCGWYPSARAVLLWNLEETGKSLSVAYNDKRIPVEVDALDVALIDIE
ncbi:MAG: twin-arginine translocation signal domain-containing protein [Candidatus Hydrogenedentes bacterium]|nr:twin-arginine translocation signal domain-containing protein [Candidatus Hydrogenedentota bacterium]